MEDEELKGWWFDVVETSNNVYSVTGSDQQGRKVSRQGTDVDELLRECHEDAQEIQRQVEGEQEHKLTR